MKYQTFLGLAIITGILGGVPAVVMATPLDPVSSIAQNSSTSIFAEPWEGTWENPIGYVFAFSMKLNPSTNNKFDGSINWTLKKSPEASEQSKIGLTAIEFIEGNYNSETNTAIFSGTREQDPYGIIGLDKYEISFSKGTQLLSGKTRNHGDWKGKIEGVRMTSKTDNPDNGSPGKFSVSANSDEGIPFTNPWAEQRTFTFTASGIWTYNPSQGFHTAAGHSKYQNASSNYKLPNFPEGSLLIKRKQADGSEKYEYVGSSKTISLGPSERIVFVMNDSYNGGNNYLDNQGELLISYSSELMQPIVQPVEPIGLIQTNPAPDKDNEDLGYEVVDYISKNALFGPPPESSKNISQSGGCEKDICVYDIRQGAIGDCYFLTVIAALAHHRPEFIREMIQDHKDGTYSVRFYEEKNSKLSPVYIRVDAKLIRSKKNKSSHYAGYTIKNSDTNKHDEVGIGFWVALVEKAYVKFKDGENYTQINGGLGFQAMTNITGKKARYYSDTTWGEVPSEGDFLSIEEVENLLLREGKIVTFGSRQDSWLEETLRIIHPEWATKMRSGFFGSHEYALLNANSNTQELILYNPWGSVSLKDGKRINEDRYGVITIKYEDFKKNFNLINVSD